MLLESVTAAAPEEALKLAEVKAHLRVDHTDDDDYIAELIKTAFAQAEARTWRALLSQSWRLYLDRFPTGDREIKIPKPPLVTVDSIKYQDSSDVQQTWADTNYVVDIVKEPARVYPETNANYPTTYIKRKAVEIEFTCGYSSVPDPIKHWMKIWIADAYDVLRQSYFQGGAFNIQIVRESRFADNLLSSYRAGLTV